MNFVLTKEQQFVKEQIKRFRKEVQNSPCSFCYTEKCGHYPEHCSNEFLRAIENAIEVKAGGQE
jgi:hypothetical protein